MQIIVDNNSGINEDSAVVRQLRGNRGGTPDEPLNLRGACAATKVQSSESAHTLTPTAVSEEILEVLGQIQKQIEARGKQEPIRLRASFSVMGWRLRGDGRTSWQGQGASYRALPKSSQLIDVRSVSAAATVLTCWEQLTWLFGRVGPVVVLQWLMKLRRDVEGLGVK